MTYKEALNQQISLKPIHARNDLERYLLRGEKPIPKSVALGMQALEKQIPIKPDYWGDGCDDDGNLIYDNAKCPICGHDFEYNINEWGSRYCQDCGQALDWSDDK